ncbi:MAG: PTS lactose/cellobiose transporter subunit IIA [Eubacteriaceae bacterium]|jgi:PTS system cellobiose-specific IIA component
MTSDQIVEAAFNIITYAGNARGMAMEAIELAKDGKFDEARKMIDDSRTEMNNSHTYQTELITSEANGEKNEITVLLVHSQDHLMTGMVVIDMAEQFITVYEEMAKLKNK